MKKKLLTVALVVALIAIMVSGTLAYFTSNDEVTNTFTIGSVDIEIYENDQETTSDTMPFTQPLLPIVDTQDPSSDDGYIEKVVEVKNTGDNAAFIRTHIAIPAELEGYLILDVDTTSWTQVAVSDGSKDGKAYKVYTYDYNTAVDPDAFTAELLKGVYLASNVDLKDNPADTAADLEFCKPNGDGTYTFTGFVAQEMGTNGYTSATVNVLVYSQAIQAQGFEQGATNALDSGFVQGTNPWQ